MRKMGKNSVSIATVIELQKCSIVQNVRYASKVWTITVDSLANALEAAKNMHFIVSFAYLFSDFFV
jgi:hypothetical protein